MCLFHQLLRRVCNRHHSTWEPSYLHPLSGAPPSTRTLIPLCRPPPPAWGPAHSTESRPLRGVSFPVPSPAPCVGSGPLC